MNFRNIEGIKESGFSGFRKVNELFLDNSIIPRERGVYLIIYKSAQPPDFLRVGSGGYFKGKNPNVSIDELQLNWVNGAIVVYIGKAGKERSNATLNSRLKQYLSFGQGKNVGHRGGRFIWQLKNSSDLIICWKRLPKDDPRKIELQLIKEFISEFGMRPFANLTD